MTLTVPARLTQEPLSAPRYAAEAAASLASANQIRSLVERFCLEVAGANHRLALPPLLHPSFGFSDGSHARRRSQSSFSAYVEQVQAAFWPCRCEVIELDIESSKALARLRFSGIHRGAFRGRPASGHRIACLGVALFTFEHDKITDLWLQVDSYSLSRQLEQQAPALL